MAYAVSDDEKELLTLFLMYPCSDFVFDVNNWKIRSRPGIVEPNEDGSEEIIEFRSGVDYVAIVEALSSEPILTWDTATVVVANWLKLSPTEFYHELIRFQQSVVYASQGLPSDNEVNWGRDGF